MIPRYCIFGLGDSHYWGKGTEESKFNFAEPSAISKANPEEEPSIGALFRNRYRNPF